jgi:Nucleotidyl transferase AbiEii toxin, Type IV TA system
MTANLGASVLARLLNLAKRRGDDYNSLLNRFALERLLCRVASSAHADRFMLKGALLFSIWYDQPYRPTRDADLLGFGADDAETLIATFREIAAIELDDGIVFDSASVRADDSREDNRHGGLRVRLTGRIGNARCALQVDVGFGDAVTPEPQTVVFPVLLDGMAAPTLKVCPVYTVIAEKFHAMTVLGVANTRMKDFFDIAVIAQRTHLEGAILASAIGATFARRGTPLPSEPPWPWATGSATTPRNSFNGRRSSRKAP